MQERMMGEKLGTSEDHSLAAFCWKREERAGKRVGREGFQSMGIAWVRGCDSESEKTCVGGRLRSEAVRSIA